MFVLSFSSIQLLWVTSFLLRRVELLHHDVDSAGRRAETLLVRQLARFHQNGEEAAVLGLQRRALPDGVPQPRGPGEDEPGVAEGPEAVLRHRPHRLRLSFQNQQALQQRVLRGSVLISCRDSEF